MNTQILKYQELAYSKKNRYEYDNKIILNKLNL